MDTRELIFNFFTQRKMADGLTYDTELMDSGKVNSLFALEIVLYLEKTFKIRLKGKDINKNNFRTINTMAELVERVQKK